MSLYTQIILIIFSLFYGIVFSITSDLNLNIIKNEKQIIKYLITFLFCLIFSLIYFIILQRINNGTLHIYSFICIVLSYMITHFIVINNKKWYTNHRVGGNTWQENLVNM